MNTRYTGSGTFRSIQVMRGIACLLVLAFHVALQIDAYYRISWPGHLFGQGYAGVDLFFVISGFVIAYSSQRTIGKPDWLRVYWVKRLVRIYPLYWLVLTLSIIGLVLTAPEKIPTGSVITVVAHWLAVVLLVPGHSAVNAVSWSLSHELYFYALFGLLAVNARAWVGLLIVGLATLLRVGLATDPLPYSFYLSPFNLEFGLGILVWYVSARIRPSLWLSGGALMVALLIVGLGQATVTNEDHLQRVIVFGTASGLLVLAGVLVEKLGRFHSPNWLCQIGDASYVLYLLHLPFLIIVNKLIIGWAKQPEMVLALNGVASLLVVVGSHYLHVYLEKPLIRRLLPSVMKFAGRSASARPNQAL